MIDITFIETAICIIWALEVIPIHGLLHWTKNFIHTKLPKTNFCNTYSSFSSLSSYEILNLFVALQVLNIGHSTFDYDTQIAVCDTPMFISHCQTRRIFLPVLVLTPVNVCVLSVICSFISARNCLYMLDMHPLKSFLTLCLSLEKLSNIFPAPDNVWLYFSLYRYLSAVELYRWCFQRCTVHVLKTGLVFLYLPKAFHDFLAIYWLGLLTVCKRIILLFVVSTTDIKIIIHSYLNLAKKKTNYFCKIIII